MCVLSVYSRLILGGFSGVSMFRKLPGISRFSALLRCFCDIEDIVLVYGIYRCCMKKC